jgi:tRNA threonylcarbamoyl adenosine modification protein (Sua5/YciO/YrdC/YwlC family)
MIEYIIAENPDDRVLNKASSLLKEGGLVVLPTDTNWLVLCDVFNKKGVEKLYKIKNEGTLKHYSVICDSVSRASDVALIYDKAFRLIRKKIPGHFTFIFEATKKITRAVQANKTDKQVGVRFPPCVLAQKLIEAHGNVLLSTHIDNEMLQLSADEMIYSYQIEELLMGKIDMILDPGEYTFVGSTTIVDLSDESDIHVVRQGSGDW